MPEGFSVKPHYVSGFGDLMAAEASTIGDIDEHAMLYAAPRESDYTGLMSALRKPVALYTDALEDRLRWRAQVSRETGQELVRTAWVYLDKEEANTGKFDGTGILKPDEDAEKYTESEPKLPALKIKDQVDLHDLFPGLGGMAMLLDWFLVEVLGWSFYNDVIDKMLGNWNALDGAGAALINVGNAAEEVAKSMKDGQDKVGEKWDGGAAQKCEEYITALREAVNEEGPLNRLVGELLKLIATEAEGVIADIMINLMIPFEELWDDLGPGVMTGCPAFVPEELLARGRTTAEAYEYLFDYAKNIVGGQGRLTDEAAEFIDGLKNLGDMATKVDELEGQIRGFVEGGKTAISTTKDLKELADSSEFDEAPDDAYSSGKDPERDGE